VIKQINKFGGILVDYDENVFKTPTLENKLLIKDQNYRDIYQTTKEIPNCGEVGAVKMPLDCQLLV